MVLIRRTLVRLILVSSLANVPGAVVGLSNSEIISYLCAPGRDITKLSRDVLGTLLTSAWYLHANREGKLYFKNVQNLVAKLKTTADSYNRESSLRELKNFLLATFTPSMKDCYQEVFALPAVDEIEIKQDKVTLVICEPYNGGLQPILRKFYEDLDFKNRIVYLTGARGTLDKLLEGSAYLKAISHVLSEMNVEKVPDNDPQRVMARDIQDRVTLQLLSALRETFTTLFYPHTMGPGSAGLIDAGFLMNFTNNKYNGEMQIRETLKSRQKFTEDILSDAFRKKCEQRLFTLPSMQWSEIKRRAAASPAWQWHRPDALEALKADLLRKDQWRESGNYVERGPFAKPHTSVLVQEVQRDDETGTIVLKITPIHGDMVYYEIGSIATPASLQISDLRSFETRDLEISFLCVNSKGEHATGDPLTWKNRIILKHRVYQSESGKMVELRAIPDVPIRYTTDGSDPLVAGGLYDGPFVVPPGTVYVLAAGQKKYEGKNRVPLSLNEATNYSAYGNYATTEKNDLNSDVLRIGISWDKKEDFKIDPTSPITWNHRHKLDATKESYEFLARMKKFQAEVLAARVTVAAQRHWIELTFDDTLSIEAEKLESAIDNLRGFLAEGQVSLDVNALQFLSGQRFLEWIAEARANILPEEVHQ